MNVQRKWTNAHMHVPLFANRESSMPFYRTEMLSPSSTSSRA